MKTMVHHDARGPEETVQNLSAVVSAGPASGNPSTGMRETGVSDGAPSEDSGRLAQSQPRLFDRMAD
jgi:hypothetical protein